MVKLRMRRTGCNNHATYRIVAADARSPRDGKFLEILGWYDTQIKDDNFKIDLERVDYWLKNGAKPSTTVASLQEGMCSLIENSPLPEGNTAIFTSPFLGKTVSMPSET